MGGGGGGGGGVHSKDFFPKSTKKQLCKSNKILEQDLSFLDKHVNS